MKSFGNEEIEDGSTACEMRLMCKRISYRYMGLYHSGLGAMTTMVTIGVLVAGAVMMTNGRLELTDLITFLLYINNFTEPVKKLIDFTEQFQNGYTGYERFLEIMNVDPDIKDAPDAVKLSDVKGDITFEDVSFRYEEGLLVLSHVDLGRPCGEYLRHRSPEGKNHSLQPDPEILRCG